MRLGSLGFITKTAMMAVIFTVLSIGLVVDEALSAPANQTSESTSSNAGETSDHEEKPAKFTNPFSTADDSGIGYSRGESRTTLGEKRGWRFAKQTKLAYKFGTSFDSFANEREQSQYFGLKFGADGYVQFMDGLNFRARGSADVSSGYAQSRFGENLGRSGFYFQDAVLSARAIDSELVRVYIAGGALDQGALDAPLLMAKQPFPGFKETIVFGNSKQYQFKFWSQQVIPTSKTLSTRTVDAEVTPSLYTETLELNMYPIESLRTTAAISHFTFNNLPSAVAQESLVYGNSIDEVGPNTSRFKYRFEGFLARGEFQYEVTSNFAINIEGYALQNAAAPEGYRNAQFVRLGTVLRLPGDIDLHSNLVTFFAEDDASPGFYNDSSLGHNNRKGMGVTARAFFHRQRFQIRAAYIDADVINYNINQSRQQTLSIGFETFYEML